MNKLQTQGRLSSIQATADKNNPRKFLAWLKKGKNVLYAIDQDTKYSLNDIIADVFNDF